MLINFNETTANRLKGANFESVTIPNLLIDSLAAMDEHGSQEFGSQYLGQLRFIYPIEDQSAYLAAVEDYASANDSQTSMNGRIPFQLENDHLAIGYVQTQRSGRPRFTNHGHPRWQQSHQQIIDKTKQTQQPSRTYNYANFSFRAIQFQGDQGVDVYTDKLTDIQLPLLSHQLSQAHRLCFTHPHDKAQQSMTGLQNILENNPVLLAIDELSGDIAAVGLMEREDKLVLNRFVSSEPTFFTLPDFRRKGLTSRLREEIKRVIDHQTETICFAESIRYTSLPASLKHFELSGTRDLIISGDLGSEYTAIGPADGQNSGYMAMGLSHYVSSDIRLNPDDQF